jgi:hypothetical protein
MARRQSVPSPMSSPQASQRPSTSWKRCCFVASENDRAAVVTVGNYDAPRAHRLVVGRWTHILRRWALVKFLAIVNHFLPAGGVRGQGENEYDCGFHSIFFIGMVAYLPLVLPLSDEVILPFRPTPRRFLCLLICDSAWSFRSKFLSAHRTFQRGAPEEFFVIGRGQKQWNLFTTS